jgi:hypothetical protein
MVNGMSGVGGGMGMLGGMFGGGGAGAPNPYAGMNPYMAAPSMAQRLAGQPAPGQGGPQGPIPPHIQAMLAQMQARQNSYGNLPDNANPASGNWGGIVPPQPGQTPWGQAGPQGQMPQGQGMPGGNWGGILSGLMGGQGFAPQMRQPARAQQMARQQQMQARPPARQPRRGFTYAGANYFPGTISLSGY